MPNDEVTVAVEPSAVTGPASPADETLDANRLTPGTIVSRRYRIVSLLGRGGMGAVYRADDLRLGQPVALKFLTRGGNDPAVRERLYSEVRLGRQITHPNVCRIYDLVETDNARFLSMEYVDGEDLASLLRRVGRLAPERALRIAREICAAVDAAHAQGIVHRDLKPANVMIDGRGSARVTDFGLAAPMNTDAEGLIAGTPQYMAPEQIAGESGVSSDIYALGLVLFELFSGERIFKGTDIARMVEERRQAKPLLRTFVPDVDPRIEQVLMACIQEDPALRPGSVREVLVRMPGGDRLLPDVAENETPPPDLIAAAQVRGELSVPIAWALVALCLVGVATMTIVDSKRTIIGVGLPEPPDVLRDRALQTVRAAGRAPAPHHMTSFGVDNANAQHFQEANRGVPIDAVVFWYRQSERTMRPWGRSGRIHFEDPPVNRPGMVNVTLSADGSLIEFRLVPPDRYGVAHFATTRWQPFLQAAKAPHAREVAPSWTPPVAADRRWAWESGTGESLKRFEAASLGGVPVWFKRYAVWEKPRESAPSGGPPAWFYVFDVLFFALAIPAAWAARRNLRAGRGDRHGAMKIATIVAVLRLAQWISGASYVGAFVDLWRLLEALAFSLFDGLLFWLLYIAIEPSIRKRTPAIFVGWSRLLTSRVRDAQVGREILIGSAVSALEVILHAASDYFFGGTAPAAAGDAFTLTHQERFFTQMFGVALLGGLFAFGILIGIYGTTALLRRYWIAAVAWMAIAALGWTPWFVWESLPFYALAIATSQVVMMALRLFILRRVGFLALVASFQLIFVMMQAAPLTLNTSTWYFWQTMFALSVVIVGVFAAFRVSLGGKSPFGKTFAFD